MKRKSRKMDPFAQNWQDEDIQRERRRGRELRQSQWWKRQLAKGRCHYCQQAISPQELTMDHLIPISRGGKTTKGNVVPACKACNSKKKQLLPIEWEAYLEGLP
jgi:5-methylcytosine-specific restriction endonuclease McrA